MCEGETGISERPGFSFFSQKGNCKEKGKKKRSVVASKLLGRCGQETAGVSSLLHRVQTRVPAGERGASSEGAAG